MVTDISFMDQGGPHVEYVVEAAGAERAQLASVRALLEGMPAQDTVELVGAAGSAALPASLRQVLLQAVQFLADGAHVALAPIDELLTTGEAAELLNVSRPYVVRLITEGKLAFEMCGAHRRIRYQDVMAYRSERDGRRRASLERMAALWADADGSYTEAPPAHVETQVPASSA
jgi:excisionase family DNA binding protein